MMYYKYKNNMGGQSVGLQMFEKAHGFKTIIKKRKNIFSEVRFSQASFSGHMVLLKAVKTLDLLIFSATKLLLDVIRFYRENRKP